MKKLLGLIVLDLLLCNNAIVATNADSIAQAATVGIWKSGDKEYEKELLKVGKEMGFDPTALQNMIDINKRGIKSEERTVLKNKHLEGINENILKVKI